MPQGAVPALPARFARHLFHSLANEKSRCPPVLVSTGVADRGGNMGVRHRELPIEGVQFHPESILTEHGHAMLRNFLDRADK